MWKTLLKDRSYRFNLVVSIFIFLIAAATLKLSGLRAESIDAPALPDLIHSSIPLVDVTFISTFGFIVVQILFWGYFISKKPEELPYAIKVYSMFVLFRSLFITITSFGAPAVRIDDVPFLNGLFGSLYFTKDLFPSGHTGTPFIAYLLIKKQPWKNIMLGLTLLMGASVLLLKVHYSIDVLGALFVAYGAKAFYDWLRENLNPYLQSWFSIIPLPLALKKVL
ncbi:hypothetical protein COV20_05105 [Candidatus Woesearchaeota archaeon CG10_big_fil_rev_8_21_14_0_10_45_16]|nr:MAG: hypothetical protein COV20_05105 [Candidatus Woesearchaeota archaeon CG10_big_fil_rev_8_21_14_0_10_45_16]